MKILKTCSVFLAIACACAGGSVAVAKDLTAYAMIKEGNRYVGEHAKDKVVEIRSERSVGGLSPNVWYVVYYDNTASFKTTEVKFVGGRMVHVKRPFRLFDPMTGADNPVDRDQLRVDSDQAVRAALKESLFEKINIVSVELLLEQTKDANQPWWRVRLWATKLRDPSKIVKIGDIFVGADDGKVLQTKLHLDRVN